MLNPTAIHCDICNTGREHPHVCPRKVVEMYEVDVGYRQAITQILLDLVESEPQVRTALRDALAADAAD